VSSKSFDANSARTPATWAWKVTRHVDDHGVWKCVDGSLVKQESFQSVPMTLSKVEAGTLERLFNVVWEDFMGR